MTPDPQRVAKIIRDVAENIILPRFQQLASHEISVKSSGDLVTIADEEAERVVDLIPNSRLLSWPKVGHSPHIARNHDFIRAAKRFAAE